MIVDWSGAPEDCIGALVAKVGNSHFPKVTFVRHAIFEQGRVRGDSCEGMSLCAYLDVWAWEDRPWTGEGLPPVGTVVELCNVKTVLADDFDYDQHCIVDTWRNGDRLEVIARRNVHGTEGVIVFNANRMQASAIMRGFYKPAKTPEQIAADEIQSIRDEIGYQRPQLGACPVEAMYNLGYRKQVAP